MVMSRIGELIHQLNSRPRSRDAVAAALSFLLGLALLQFGGYRIWVAAAPLPAPAAWSTGGAFLLLLIAMAALAVGRSTRPLLVLAASVPVLAADLCLGGSLGVVILFADFVYCAFRYGGDRGVRVLLAVIVGLGAGVLIVFAFFPSTGARFVHVALQWALIVLLSSLWGWNVRTERQRTRSAMAEEHHRATQRLRRSIAHDLHDLVANQIAVAGLNVEAARMAVAGRRDDAVEDSLVRAARGADDAGRELRRLIAVLMTVDEIDGPAERAPRGDELDALLPVGRTLLRQGADLDEALAALPPRSAVITMRAIYELVANAVKHGSGDVELDVAADPLTVRVANAVAEVERGAEGNGIGITGAAMLLAGAGGRVESAAVAGDRWSATMTVPVSEEEAQHA